jgi:peptidoglycan/LPS O-acetylase OafA/YrhL
MSSQAANRQTNIIGIEVGRGFAAFLVLTSHYAFLFVAGSHPVDALSTGVDFFFVISGFVFAPNILQKSSHTTAFYVRRFFRIYPLYVVAVMAMWLIKDSEDTGLLVKHLLFLHSSFNFYETFSLNPAFWSLPVEIEFYILIPVIAWFMQKYSPPLWLLILLFLLLRNIIFALSTPYDQANIFTLITLHLPAIFVEFLFGLLCYKYLFIQKVTVPVLSHIVGFILSVSVMTYLACLYGKYGNAWLQSNVLINANYNIVYALCYSVILVNLVDLFRWLNDRGWQIFASVLGSLSYGVYLSHNFSIAVLAKTGYLTENLDGFLLAFTLTVVLSLLGYYLLENPARNFGRHFAHKIKHKTAKK